MTHLPRRIAPFCVLFALVALIPFTRPAQAASFVVTSTSASGPGSLAQAIADANANPGPDMITFNIMTPSEPEGFWLIAAPTLPDLSGGGTTIDATSQPGGRSDGGPKVAITNAGFVVTSADNTIQGFTINGTAYGIRIDGQGATGNKVYGNYIGTNWNGTIAQPNGQAGVAIKNGAGNNIIGGLGAGQRNLISGNGSGDNRAQIVIESDPPQTTAKELRGNQIVGNYIGTTASGDSALPGTSHGILLGNNAVANIVGPGNVISGNAPPNAKLPVFGVALDGIFTPGLAATEVHNVVKGNLIGLNAAATAALPNGSGDTTNVGGGGVRVKQIGQNVIGGSAATDRNYISGHLGGKMYGILIDAECKSDLAPATTVTGNYIGLNGTGTGAIPNTQGIRIAPDSAVATAAQIAPCNTVVGPGNVISGNDSDGIRLIGVQDALDDRQARNNQIISNMIGTTPAGNAALPNKGNGIYITRGAHHNTVGGSLALRNVIASNSQSGIMIETFSSDAAIPQNQPDNNTISGNAIGTSADGSARLGNGTFGILMRGSASNNTVGPDNRIAYNTSDAIQISGGSGNRITRTTTVGNGGFGIRLLLSANGGMQPPVNIKIENGVLTGQVQGCASCTVEVFSSATLEIGEGNNFVASLTTDAQGNFSLPVTVGNPPSIFSLTATDSLGNTSQFSGSSARVLLPVVIK